METSRAETHSSQTMTSGESSSARAMAMRLHWPPLSSDGYFPSADSASPTRPSISAARRLADAASYESSSTCIGSVRIFSTVKYGFMDSFGF